MKTKKELSPKIFKSTDGRYHIHLWYKNKRYRFANGRAIEENLMPNLLEEPESMKNVKRNISVLLRDELETHGVFPNYMRIKLPRTTPTAAQTNKGRRKASKRH